MKLTLTLPLPWRIVCSYTTLTHWTNIEIPCIKEGNVALILAIMANQGIIVMDYKQFAQEWC